MGMYASVHTRLILRANMQANNFEYQWTNNFWQVSHFNQQHVLRSSLYENHSNAANAYCQIKSFELVDDDCLSYSESNSYAGVLIGPTDAALIPT